MFVPVKFLLTFVQRKCPQIISLQSRDTQHHLLRRHIVVRNPETIPEIIDGRKTVGIDECTAAQFERSNPIQSIGLDFPIRKILSDDIPTLTK